MKRRLLSLALLSAAICIVSCGSDGDGLAPEQGQQSDNLDMVFMTFHAGYAGQDSGATSKTAIGETNASNPKEIGLLFSAGDEIKVYDSNAEKSSVFTSDIPESKKTAPTCNFEGFISESGNYFAIMPSSGEIGPHQATASVPGAQTAVAGSFDRNAHVMLAFSYSSELLFQTANAFLKFTAPCDLNEVKIQGMNGEKIAGNITIKGIDNEYKDFTVSEGTETSITLSGTITKGETYYIAYVPGNFNNGLKLSFTNSNGVKGEYLTGSFSSFSNKLTKVSDSKLEAVAFNIVTSEYLNDYLASCSGSVATTIILSDYNAETVRTALIGNSAKKVNLTLPKETTKIPAKAFQGCGNLESVEILGDITSFGDVNCDVFDGCKKDLEVYVTQATYTNISNLQCEGGKDGDNVSGTDKYEYEGVIISKLNVASSNVEVESLPKVDLTD